MNKYKVKEVIKIQVMWTGDNFCCGLSDDVLGTVVATHRTLQGLKDSFSESLRLHIQGCVMDGDILPAYLVS